MCCADGFQTLWETGFSSDEIAPDPNGYESRKRREIWNEVVSARRKRLGGFSMDWMPAIIVLTVMPLVVILLYAGPALLCVNDLAYLSNVMRDDGGDEKHLDIYSYFEAVTKEKPTLTMIIECYHMETRTSGTGKNRKSRRVRVVTWRGSREIQYQTWYDQSQRPEGLAQFPVVKMLCNKSPITFADTHTEEHVTEQRRRFQAENRHRDHRMSFREVYRLETFKPNVLFKRNGSATNCMQQRWYVFFTLLCCNWAYRYWFERASTRTTINISKVISIEGSFNPADNDLPADEKAFIKSLDAKNATRVRCFSWLMVVGVMVPAVLLVRFFVFQYDPNFI